MSTVDELRASGALQAGVCRRAGSPTYAAVITAAAERLEDGGAVADLLRADGRDPTRSTVFLRLLGAVHRLVLDDPGVPLAAYYPTVGGTAAPAEAVPCFFALVEARRALVEAEMQADVQTNEVGRSVPLVAALAWLSAGDPRPVRLLEVGASAGLNLWLDRYRVRAGDRAWGPATASLELLGDFLGERPPSAGIDVRDRRGCDRNPIDLTVPASRRVLRSFVWPEHTARLERLDRAVAAFQPVPVDREGAGRWLHRVLAEPMAGTRTVVLHSVVTPFLAADEREEMASALDGAGVRATDAAPLSHVWLEPVGERYEVIELGCTTWPGGRSVRLATCSAHGDAIAWRPAPVDPLLQR